MKNEGTQYSCPYCNKEMEKGFVEQTNILIPLEWYPAKWDGEILVSKKRNIKLTSSLKGGSLTVYRCENCRKMVIDEDMIDV
ncbi:MAG: hypothetical protein IKU09_07485 [Firmicutes bacterium]|nr:hypothetical protein [Bacillota bacterium]